ncbi:hypothetical protein NSK_003626 [Nannochloropsis salina CCMP1776]|uniref:beta-galactosidase n=1 Tax=Nannochloropsis salina CCMP1776 TaxID=1027361 RepID=A0A4D9D5D8_9STRA|nr:hypothetical protein NSK_003626 [Nannochloropsis salina CCMP1776]|eukprot:TFJ85203.1 hypothetical protein NSK_003626 [Nannochloropsis salina CCMP1776]
MPDHDQPMEVSKPIKYPGWDQAEAPWTTTALPNALILPLFLFTGRQAGVLRCGVGALLVGTFAALVRVQQISLWWGMLFLPPALALFLSSYEVVFSRPDWVDPEVFGRKKLPAHAPLAYHTSIEAARKAAMSHSLRSESENIILLSGPASAGQWRFKYAPSVSAAPLHFEDPGFPADDWDTDVPVPGNWQLCKDASTGEPRFDIPVYTNFRYPIPLHPPYVPRGNPTGCYRRTFDVPAALLEKGGRAHLLFHGAGSAFHVWVNGSLAGYSQDGKLAAEFDVTGLVHRDGQSNVLALRVLRWSDGSYLEDQDHWRLSGIERDVELVMIPGAGSGFSLSDYTAVARLDSQHEHGHLDVTVQVARHRIFPGSFQVQALLYEDSEGGALVGKASVVKDGTSTAAASGASPTEVFVSIPVKNPRKWTAETPQLYTLVLTLSTEGLGEGKTPSTLQQAEGCRVGFRAVEIRDSQLCVNGQPLVVAGVNRHEHDPDTGKVVDEASMVQDIVLLKRYNFNAIRASHYPNHPRWYELCDELGIWVVDEANVETHGMKPIGRISADPVWRAAYVDRMVRMVQTHKNHACVVVWSLGNESGDGQNLQAGREAIKALDPTRPVQYEGGGADMCGTGRTSLTDIQCPMYAVPAAAIQMAQSTRDARPVILCEYSHAMGNSNGNLFKYWDAVWALPRFQGGFIWDYVDQGLRHTDRLTGRSYWAYGGDFGDVDGPCSGHGQFCINGVVFPDRAPHPALHEAKHLQSPVKFHVQGPSSTRRTPMALTLGIENRYSFQSLAHLTFHWALKSDAGVLAAGTLNVEGKEVGPGQRVEVTQDVGQDGRPGSPSEPPRKLMSVLAASSPFKRSNGEKKDKRTGGNDSTTGGTEGGIPSESSGLGGTSVWSTAWVEVTALLKADTPWAPKGHVVARETFLQALVGVSEGASGDRVPVPLLTMPALELRQERTEEGQGPWTAHAAAGEEAVLVVSGTKTSKGKDWRVVFGKRSGRLLEYRVGGVDLLVPQTGGPEHAFLRAATDNDRAGYPVSATFVTPKWLCDALEPYSPWNVLSYYARWRRLGLCLDGLETSVQEVTPVVHTTKRVEILVRATVSTAQAGPLLDVQTRYIVYGSMDVKMGIKVVSLYENQTKAPLHLPRVGVALQLPREFTDVSWLGLGPHESYSDRKRSGLLDVHHAHVRDLHTPYVVPSENGGRADVRWAALRDPESKMGLLLRCTNGPVHEVEDEGTPEKRNKSVHTPGTFQFNASMHSVRELEQATRTCELPTWEEAQRLYVHVDHRHMGVGGDNTWEPDLIHSEFLVPCVGTWEYDVYLSPLVPDEEPYAKACRVLE